MKSLDKFFQTPRGRAVAVIGCVLAVLAMYMAYRSAFGPSALAEHSRRRPYICAETGKSFEVVLEPGMNIPVHSPFSGKDTGYPAELCYWNADGSIKTKPTPVLLHSLVGKPEPTFCPDCGRLVVGHNPKAREGMTPPPTEAEYQSKRRKPAAN